MRLKSITISHGRDGTAAFAIVTFKSNAEAQSFLGCGEQDVDHNGARLRVKPIAPGADVGSVCCKIVD